MGREARDVLSYRYATSPESSHTGYPRPKVLLSRANIALTARHPSHPNPIGMWSPRRASGWRLTAFPLVGLGVEPPAGIEPATPSLPWNHQEPLCGPPSPQVTPDRRGRSYRFSFGAVMRSLCSRLALMVATSRSNSDRIRRWTSGAAIAAARGYDFHQRCVWLKRVPCQNCILGAAHTRRAYCFGAGPSLVGAM
jgi:hypothetical protein